MPVINPDGTDPRAMPLVPPDNPGDSAMHKFFAATGRFAVRFRWAVVPATVVLLGRWNWWPSTHGTPGQTALEPQPAPEPAHCR